MVGSEAGQRARAGAPPRERVATAMLDLALERGYEATTLEALCQRAGVSEAEFHQHFSDRQACLIAVYTANNELFDRHLQAAYAAHQGWRDALRAAAYAAADFLAERPREVRFNVIAVLSGGDMLAAVRDAYLQQLVDLVDAGRAELEDPDSLGRSVAESAIGAIFERLLRDVHRGEDVAAARAVVPELMYIAVRPYLGHEVAREELSIPPPPEASSPPNEEPGLASSDRPSPRQRIEAAMIDLVVTQGYESTTIAMILQQAEVAEVDFKREFAGKEDCALQTFDDYAERFTELVAAAYEAEDNWRDSLRAAAYAAARWIRDRPNATRYGVLDFLSASELAQVSREAIFQNFVEMIDRGRAEADDPAAVPSSAPVTAIGAIAEMLTQRLGSGGAADPFSMVPQLMYTVVRPYLGHEIAREELSIPPPPEPIPAAGLQPRKQSRTQIETPVQTSASSRYLPPVPKAEPPSEENPPGLSRLPPGRHGLSRDFVSQNQRDRLVAGIIAAVAEHGYHDATITQIAAAAGVSRRTFYTYFDSKEACFFAAYQVIGVHLGEVSRAAAEGAQGWPQRVRAQIGAALEVFAANPDLARFYMIAPSRAGEEIAARYRLGAARVLAQLTEAVPADLPVPTQPVQNALAGGMAALIAAKVEAGEGERLSELLPDLTELFLTPYLGREAASRAARQAT